MAKKQNNTASTGDNVLIGILIALASVGAIACFILGGIAFFNGRQGTADQPSAAQTATQTQKTAEPSNRPEPEQPTDQEEYVLDLDTVASILRISLVENFGENNYDLEYDDTGMTVNVWRDNVALGAAAAVTGDEAAKEAWDFLVESQKSFCNTIYEQIEDTGKENYYVMMNVLNDMDKSKTLLSILNGTVIYNSVSD